MTAGGWDVIAPPRFTEAEAEAAFDSPEWRDEVDALADALDERGDS